MCKIIKLMFKATNCQSYVLHVTEKVIVTNWINDNTESLLSPKQSELCTVGEHVEGSLIQAV